MVHLQPQHLILWHDQMNRSKYLVTGIVASVYWCALKQHYALFCIPEQESNWIKRVGYQINLNTIWDIPIPVCVYDSVCVCVYSCMWMHVCMTVCMCVQLYVSVCMHVWLNKMNEWIYMYAAYKLHKTLHVNSTWYTQHIHVGSRKLKYQRNSYQVETAPTQPPPAELLETRRGRTAVASFASTNEKHYVFCINAMKKAYSIT